MVYKFRPGYNAPVSAQIVGEQLEQIRQRHDGTMTPANVIADAKSVASPLHDCFEWSNREAANLYREDQARRLIRSVDVIIENLNNGDQDKHQQAFVSVARPFMEGPAYTSTAEALSDEEMTEIVLSNARAQIRGWRRRYGHLAGIAADIGRVVEAIDELEMIPA